MDRGGTVWLDLYGGEKVEMINFTEANPCVISKCDYRRVIYRKDFYSVFTPKLGQIQNKPATYADKRSKNIHGIFLDMGEPISEGCLKKITNFTNCEKVLFHNL